MKRAMARLEHLSQHPLVLLPSEHAQLQVGAGLAAAVVYFNLDVSAVL